MGLRLGYISRYTMKVFIFLTAFLLLSAGTDANILDSIKNGLSKVGDFFNNTFNDAKEIGKSVLNKAVEHGKDLLGQAGQALIGSLLNNLETNVGKRSVMNRQKVIDTIKNGIAKAKGVMDAMKAKLQESFEQSLEMLKAMAEKVSSFDFLCNMKNGVEGLEKMIDGAVDKHTRVARNILDNLPDWLLKQLTNMLGDLANAGIDKINEAIDTLLGKRDLSHQKRLLDALAQIGQSIGDFFKPHVDKIVEGVKSMGESLKNAAGNALETIKGHVNTLGDKLKGHVDELKNHGEKILGHGANALNALKDAVGDIINQTIGNIGENVKGIIDTGKDAGKVIGEHISGSETY